MAQTYWLIQYPRHAIHKELEVLRSVQSAEVVTVIILRWSSPTILWNGVQKKHKKEL